MIQFSSNMVSADERILQICTTIGRRKQALMSKPKPSARHCDTQSQSREPVTTGQPQTVGAPVGIRATANNPRCTTGAAKSPKDIRKQYRPRRASSSNAHTDKRNSLRDPKHTTTLSTHIYTQPTQWWSQHPRTHPVPRLSATGRDIPHSKPPPSPS